METRYTKSHEWIVIEADDLGTVGVSERLILENGRVNYVELPDVGAEFEQDEPIGILETRDGEEITVHSPVTGEVVAVNDALEDDPGLVSVSPEGDGWLFRIRPEFSVELESLMTTEEYEFYEPEKDDADDDLDEEY